MGTGSACTANEDHNRRFVVKWGRLLSGLVVLFALVALVFIVFGGGIGVPELAVIAVLAAAGIVFVIRRARLTQGSPTPQGNLKG
jgi:hypothetical protein